MFIDLATAVKAHIHHPKTTFAQLDRICADLRASLLYPWMCILLRARLINLLDQAQRRRRELGNVANF